MFSLKPRTFVRPIAQSIRTAQPVRMWHTNELGQGRSHATGESKVPGSVQEAAPTGLENALPDQVRSFF